MSNSNFLMSIGAAVATSRLARMITNLDANSVLGSVGLERHRSHVWQNLAIFGAGALAGAGAALLLAPSTGNDLRARLGGQIDRLATAASEAVEDVKAEAPALLSRVTGASPTGTNQSDTSHSRHG